MVFDAVTICGPGDKLTALSLNVVYSVEMLNGRNVTLLQNKKKFIDDIHLNLKRNILICCMIIHAAIMCFSCCSQMCMIPCFIRILSSRFFVQIFCITVIWFYLFFSQCFYLQTSYLYHKTGILEIIYFKNL